MRITWKSGSGVLCLEQGVIPRSWLQSDRSYAAPNPDRGTTGNAVAWWLTRGYTGYADPTVAGSVASVAVRRCRTAVLGGSLQVAPEARLLGDTSWHALLRQVSSESRTDLPYSGATHGPPNPQQAPFFQARHQLINYQFIGLGTFRKVVDVCVGRCLVHKDRDDSPVNIRDIRNSRLNTGGVSRFRQLTTNNLLASNIGIQIVGLTQRVYRLNKFLAGQSGIFSYFSIKVQLRG